MAYKLKCFLVAPLESWYTKSCIWTPNLALHVQINHVVAKFRYYFVIMTLRSASFKLPKDNNNNNNNNLFRQGGALSLAVFQFFKDENITRTCFIIDINLIFN